MARILLPLLLLLTAWSGAHAQSTGFERSALIIETADGKQHRFSVELAVTPQQQAQGLMYRERLETEAGMLFLYEPPQEIAMWMKNTVIPLDMIFVDESGAVTGVAERTIPFSTQTIESPGLARAVLELNAGTAERLNIAPGARLIHQAFR
ncbi:DUF192 domain-containing protein [Oceanibaculum pacificum]|uniref:DUF192 domain-containing protein n=1 Tax=Oceanibaculum pacificum TaxID=580166 RepID=A0A154VXD7_9PROT|nr:DUF192 domain-containing protein [Oceanibaculum pacificum]KZD05863.1 hypothetical protein AUP43_02830 [Oceanibaculum pacificum]